MATISNPFRRKQDAILGVDLSNQHSRPASQASCGSHSDTACGRRRIFVRNVGAIPAQITQFQQIPEHRALTPDPVVEHDRREDEANSLADIRREIESVYNGSDYHDSYTMSPTSESHDPFDEEEDEEEDDEEYDSLEDDMSMYAGTVLPRRRLHQSKRMAEMRESASSVRSSSALGFRSNSTGSTALPSKAERMLGMAPKRAYSTALHPASRVSKSKHGGLAPKAQRLLGVKADMIKKARQQSERGCSDGYGSSSMTMGPGTDVEDFKRLLLAGRSKQFGSRKANTESVSDASSLSRSSMMDSQTSRSSRELLSPDADTPTWTSPNSAPPPWLGVHPAFRKKASVDSEMFSPVSPHTVLGGSSPVSVPMYANFNAIESQMHPAGAVELDAGPVGPPSPVELAVPESDMIARSAPSNIHEMSSLPRSPKSDRPRTTDNRLGPQRSSSSLLANASGERSSSADDAEPFRRQERPSAIFENPNIFEMPADMPEISPRPNMQMMDSFPAPPTPPPSGRSVPGKSSRLHQSTSAPSPPHSSPRAPPQRPPPAIPTQKSTSDGNEPSSVDFAAGRTRQHSDDNLLSPHSTESRSLHPQPSLTEVSSNRSNPEGAPPLTALSVPSPLAMAAAEGRPITKEAPPPLRSPDDYPPTKQKLAAQGEKKRVELSDKDPSGTPVSHRAAKKLIDDDAESIHRPFSWQSTRTMRSTTIGGEDGAETPPMPPPLALTIPSDAVRKVASHLNYNDRSGAVTATPSTATSARSRASRLEKALESALSKDGMDKALSGEKIEDLFRSAGAEELFLDCSKESRELIGLEGLEGEDTEEARQAHRRARDLLKDLGELQNEVDRLRRLYEEGGPLEGVEGLDLKGGASTI